MLLASESRPRGCNRSHFGYAGEADGLAEKRHEFFRQVERRTDLASFDPRHGRRSDVDQRRELTNAKLGWDRLACGPSAAARAQSNPVFVRSMEAA